MTENKAYIYIDEFGNTALNLDKSGTFSHFIYCSVIIKESNANQAEVVRQEICKKFSLGPDIKSRNFKDKHFDKRLKVLKYFVENLDFTIDVLVVDKVKLLESEGLKYKQIFYKYFQNLFVTKYADKYESYSIWADKVGEQFALELQEYIRRTGAAPTLFQPDLQFFLQDDKVEKRIQFADLIAGSLGKVFCSSHSHPRAQEIFEIVHTRLNVEFFPYVSIRSTVSNNSGKHDREIVEITLKAVESHLESLKQNNRREEFRLLQLLVLNFSIDPFRLVPTNELTKSLAHMFGNATDEKVRTWVRNLRYAGIFIISHPGKPGYKLANSYFDITQQFDHYLKYVLPMLRKIKILNSSLAMETFNEINILENDSSFQELKNILAGLDRK